MTKNYPNQVECLLIFKKWERSLIMAVMTIHNSKKLCLNYLNLNKNY